jgi:transcriptional regulator with XRE-family HTH domain
MAKRTPPPPSRPAQLVFGDDRPRARVEPELHGGGTQSDGTVNFPVAEGPIVVRMTPGVAPDESEDHGDDETFVWRRNPEFPNYLRRTREKAGLSVRQAAPAIGVSVPYLSRLETGGPAKRPDVQRLYRMADVYGVDRRAMLVNAGVKVELPPELAYFDKLDSQFAALMLDPTIKPALLTEDALSYFSDRLKIQIIEWADKLTRQPDPHAYLMKLLDKGAQ